MKTPLTGQALKHHFSYNWWKYLLVIVLCIFVTDLLFTVTAYHAPENKKVEFYIYGYTNGDRMDEYMESVHLDRMSDMEEMTCVMLMNDEMYGPMQLTTYMAAGEGDLYLLPKSEFVSYAGSGYFIPLEDDPELMSIFDSAGISLQSGWRRNTETQETHLFGIPLNALPGLTSYCYAEDGYLGIFVNNGNDENVLKFLRILCGDMISAPESEEVPHPVGN